MLARIRKALVAAVTAGIAAYTTGASDGLVSTADWVTIVGSVLVVGFVTWVTPNAGPQPPAGVTGTYGGQLGGKG